MVHLFTNSWLIIFCQVCPISSLIIATHFYLSIVPPIKRPLCAISNAMTGVSMERFHLIGLLIKNDDRNLWHQYWVWLIANISLLKHGQNLWQLTYDIHKRCTYTRGGIQNFLNPTTMATIFSSRLITFIFKIKIINFSSLLKLLRKIIVFNMDESLFHQSNGLN